MDFNEYDARTEQTSIYPGQGTIFGLSYCGHGLTGEAGEAAEKIKKLIRGDARDPNIATLSVAEDTRLSIVKELGDQLWYISAAARELGYSLEFVAEENIKKISHRKESGTIHDHAPDA